MNQGRIWCVVNPTVGLPLFLGSVALMSFTVHFAVLNNTTWVKDFFNGTPMKQSSIETTAPAVDAAEVAKPALNFGVAQVTMSANDTTQPLSVKIKTGAPVPDVPGPG